MSALRSVRETLRSTIRSQRRIWKGKSGIPGRVVSAGRGRSSLFGLTYGHWLLGSVQKDVLGPLSDSCPRLDQSWEVGHHHDWPSAPFGLHHYHRR